MEFLRFIGEVRDAGRRQAPSWMQGLEWIYRLVEEPRERLWKRYLKHNPGFVAMFALQLTGLRGFA